MKNNKVKLFKEGFINNQYQLIDELMKVQDQLDITKKQEHGLFTALDSAILNTLFRLKGIINTIKEIAEEEIIVPEKYQKHLKLAKELAYLKGDEVILYLTDGETEKEIDVKNLINTLKSFQNGQTKKDDTTNRK